MNHRDRLIMTSNEINEKKRGRKKEKKEKKEGKHKLVAFHRLSNSPRSAHDRTSVSETLDFNGDNINYL